MVALPQLPAALVRPGQVAGVEDTERHSKEDVDDPAEEGNRSDKADYDPIGHADQDKDDDRKDPGTPPDPPDMSKDLPEVERLAEPPRVGEPHDRKEGDKRDQDRDEHHEQDAGEGGGDRRGPGRRIGRPLHPDGREDRKPPEEGQDQEDRDHVDQADDVPLPPIDKKPAPLVHVGSRPPAGEHPDDVAVVERDQKQGEDLDE